MRFLSGKDAYVRAALFGLALFASAAVLFLIAVLLVDPAEFAFVLFFLVPTLIIAAVVFFVRRWGLIVGVLGGAFGFLVATDGIGLSLSTPGAFFDFMAAILMPLGAAITFVASLIGTIQYFRKSAAGDLTPTVRTGMQAIVGALAVVAVVSLVLTILSAGSVSEAEAQGATVLKAHKVEWDVEELTGRANEPLKVLVRNDDSILHTFTIEQLGIDVKLTPWSEHIVEVNAPAGTYGYVCRVVGHEEDMTGVLTIR